MAIIFRMGVVMSISIFCFIFKVQAQVNETFADGDFTNNPVWSGDTGDFEVDAGFQLHLNAPAVTSTSMLSTPSQSIINAVWEFSVFMDFGTSSSNYCQFYLVSDNDSLQNSLNGYFVRVGYTNDEVSLYRQDGTTTTEILDGKDGRVSTSTVNARVKVTRDNIGNWEVLVDSAGGTNYVSEGTTTDNTHITSEHVGVQCVYTSTRSDKFYFDSIIVTGTFLVDTVAPEIVSVSAISDTELDVYFDENLDQVTAETTTNYQVNNSIGVPATATLDAGDNKLVHLTFGTTFTQSTEYIIQVANVEDTKGNAIGNESFTFTYFIPSYRNVVINEIFADPSPVIGLPEVEYVELLNTSTSTIDLGGMVFTDGSASATLPSYTLLPNEYVILCAFGDESEFASWGPSIGLSSFPSLNNSGDDLVLRMSDNTVMDEVSYSSAWYNDAVKDDGGYSLELIDPYTPCSGATNWSASVADAGGTPGRVNSISASNPDLTAPQILNAIVITDRIVLIRFNEIMEASTIMLSNISIDNNITIDSHRVGNQLTTDTLWLGTTLQPKIEYTVTIDNATDCSGNMIGDENSATFAVPEEAVAGDLIINEVLFNPRTGGSDFVELYNNSDKYIDLQNVSFWRVDTATYDEYPMSDDYLILAPESYIMLSENINNIATEYPNGILESYYEINDLPSYNDSDGEVIIGIADTSIASGVNVLDSFAYDKDMHIALLDDENGVSLERIDFNQSTSSPDNWHSAAQNVGFATPGYLNSQSFVVGSIADDITIDPEVITPDGDGVNDFTTISYDFSTNGNIANITIFDSHGRLIRYIAQNETLATQGFYQWDGIKQDGRKALVGNYIILFEIFDTNGNKQRFKKTMAVGAQF